ncbi:hypothetical protein [Flavobacterium sp. LM4]|uniref:hypothetical protein n=1 Tax=Flavobacterium sp. LM4 TaxID=1938609 RepID=UPI000994838D|nr:hypothetical protein [Flavobacterium sp. LM4]OOV19618.1 hypothetical protein BXU10_08220 [Flavobacterium sp. LM4]
MKSDIKYNFRVTNSINFELFEQKSTATSNYEIEFEKLEAKNFKIEVRRNGFRINEKKIDLKFEKVAYEYQKAIFPVLFDVKEGSFLLANFQEISDRISLKDEELSLQYEGHGFQYIRSQFLDNVAKDGYAMTNYFFSLGLMKVVMLCFQETENLEQYQFQWDIVPLETTLSWKGKGVLNSDTNILKYYGQEAQTENLFEKIKAYGIANKYLQELSDQAALITTRVTNETQFVTTKLDFERSETEIKINNPYFNYQEKLSINRN